MLKGWQPSIQNIVHKVFIIEWSMLESILTVLICKTQQWSQGRKRPVFIPIPKNGNVEECSTYCKTVLSSHASKVILKILQAGLQEYVNLALPDVQVGFRKGIETRDQIANICWIIENTRELKKYIYNSASLTMLKPLTMWIQETVEDS